MSGKVVRNSVWCDLMGSPQDPPRDWPWGVGAKGVKDDLKALGRGQAKAELPNCRSSPSETFSALHRRRGPWQNPLLGTEQALQHPWLPRTGGACRGPPWPWKVVSKAALGRTPTPTQICWED